MDNKTKNYALFGIKLTVEFRPTPEELEAFKDKPEELVLRKEDIVVRQMPVGIYDLASSLLDQQAEVSFTAAAIQRKLEWVESLAAESYEKIALAVQEVNQAGFFSCYGRRLGRKIAVDAAKSQGESVLKKQLSGE